MDNSIQNFLFRLRRLKAAVDIESGHIVSIRFDEGTPTRDDLLQVSRLQHLRCLDLYGTPVDDAVLAGLASLGELESLNLSCRPITDHSIKLLADLKSLRSLSLMDTAVSDASAEVLLSFERLNQVRLDGTNVSSEVVQRMLDKQPIERLCIDGKQAHPACMERIARASQLWDLNLVGSGIDDATVSYLLEARQLRRLSFLRSNVTDAGVSCLGQLEVLERLTLNGSIHVTDASLDVICRLPALQNIGMFDTGISLTGLERLLAALPQVRWIWPSPGWVRQVHGRLRQAMDANALAINQRNVEEATLENCRRALMDAIDYSWSPGREDDVGTIKTQAEEATRNQQWNQAAALYMEALERGLALFEKRFDIAENMEQ